MREPYKPEDDGKIVLPLAVLRRCDCVVESTKEEVLARVEQFASEGSIELGKTGGVELGYRNTEPVVQWKLKVRLSSILDKLNIRFGTQFTETNFLSREQVKEDMLNNEDLRQKAANNTKENFKYAFKKTFMDFVIVRMSSS